MSEFRSADECPDRAALHTPSPSGYLAWHRWAERMSKTHKQYRCPTCGYWAVWARVRGFSPTAVTR